jgi:membrane-anchored glycerophosphoryl diester phosphodiesterase (GDPDase)
MKRNRQSYFATGIITVFLGLLSRNFNVYLPEIINTYLGDALWALMIYQFVAIIFYKQKILQIAGLAITFCYLIEISQLYHAPCIDNIRSNILGGLILGFRFLWTDIIAYSIGVSFGILVEWSIYYRTNNNSSFSVHDKKKRIGTRIRRIKLIYTDII